MADETTWQAELTALEKTAKALEALGTDPAARERVLRYLLSRFWPAGIERIAFIGRDRTGCAVPPAEPAHPEANP